MMGTIVEIEEQENLGTQFKITNREGKSFYFKMYENGMDGILIYGTNNQKILFGITGKFKATGMHEDGSIQEVIGEEFKE